MAMVRSAIQRGRNRWVRMTRRPGLSVAASAPRRLIQRACAIDPKWWCQAIPVGRQIRRIARTREKPAL